MGVFLTRRINMDNNLVSFKNRTLLKDDCACYHCLKKFKKSEIKEWTDTGKTALCPHCHIDSVINDVLTEEELNKLHSEKFKVS